MTSCGHAMHPDIVSWRGACLSGHQPWWQSLRASAFTSHWVATQVTANGHSSAPQERELGIDDWMQDLGLHDQAHAQPDDQDLDKEDATSQLSDQGDETLQQAPAAKPGEPPAFADGASSLTCSPLGIRVEDSTPSPSSVAWAAAGDIPLCMMAERALWSPRVGLLGLALWHDAHGTSVARHASVWAVHATCPGANSLQQ